MSTEPGQELDSLRAVLAELNAALSESNSVVQAVDEFLTEEFDIGVWAISRPFDSQRAVGQDGRELVLSMHLAFGKVDGKSRIHVVAATLDKGEARQTPTQIVAEERTPWVDCPREIKLHAFTMLPELLSTLVGKAGEVAAQTQKTVGAVRDILNRLGRTADLASRAAVQPPFVPPAPPAAPRLPAIPPFVQAEPPPAPVVVPVAEAPPEMMHAPQSLDDIGIIANDSLFKRPRPKGTPVTSI